MKRRITSLLIAAAMTVSMMPNLSFAAENKTGNGYNSIKIPIVGSDEESVSAHSGRALKAMGISTFSEDAETEVKEVVESEVIEPQIASKGSKLIIDDYAQKITNADDVLKYYRDFYGYTLVVTYEKDGVEKSFFIGEDMISYNDSEETETFIWEAG